MKPFLIVATICNLAYGATSPVAAQPTRRPYRLNGVDLKQRVIWGAECRQPEGRGLAFGGQDQDAADGRPHTSVLSRGQWKAIHRELRANNPLQKLHGRVWSYRHEARNILASARFVYFQGLPVADEAKLLQGEVAVRLSQLAMDLATIESDLPTETADEYAQGQVRFARQHLLRARNQLPSFKDGVNAGALQRLHRVQIQLELASETLDSEPPPRAMNCGAARLPNRETEPTGNTLVYDTIMELLFASEPRIRGDSRAG